VARVVAGREVLACCCKRRCRKQAPEMEDAHSESAKGRSRIAGCGHVLCGS
jgi:hypothetical protein